MENEMPNVKLKFNDDKSRFWVSCNEEKLAIFKVEFKPIMVLGSGEQQTIEEQYSYRPPFTPHIQIKAHFPGIYECEVRRCKSNEESISVANEEVVFRPTEDERTKNAAKKQLTGLRDKLRRNKRFRIKLVLSSPPQFGDVNLRYRNGFTAPLIFTKTDKAENVCEFTIPANTKKAEIVFDGNLGKVLDKPIKL